MKTPLKQSPVSVGRVSGPPVWSPLIPQEDNCPSHTAAQRKRETGEHRGKTHGFFSVNLCVSVPLCQVFALVLVAAAWLGGAGPALAHGGGTPQMTGAEAGPYRLYAWTTPEPLRAGAIHVTVGVTQLDAQGIERAVTDADVAVTFIPVDSASAEVVLQPEIASGTGGVYYEADTDAPLEGAYRVQVSATGGAGSGAAEFRAAVLPAARSVWPWAIGAAAGVVVALTAWLAWQRSGRPAQAGARVNGKPV